jgi:hypothetical protein
MKARIAARKREALGRLAQVIACADRALSRDASFVDNDEGDTNDGDVCTSARQESVDPRRDPLSDASSKGLFLRVV